MPSQTIDSTPDATSDAGGSRQGASVSEINLGVVKDLRILNEDGQVNADLEPNIADDELLRLYRGMVLTRKLDVRMLNMQRQGQMGTFAPGLGQEATQIGQVYPLTSKDWFSPSYRSFGAQMWRGWPIDQLMLLWDGYFEGFAPPADVNDMPFSIVIGSHVPVAVGIAMGMNYQQDKNVVMVNFGDGALSEGAVAEALNFAAVYKAPVVFICENNGYAISTPIEKQSGVDHLVRRGPGFGVPSVRVDGNDILAMVSACSVACEQARRGEGPTFIEAVTYRMSVHTTADDPKVYRDDAEQTAWEQKDPIRRFELYLKSRGVLTDDDITRIGDECEQEVLAGRESFRERSTANPHEIFAYMFESMPPELREQQAEYFERLARKGLSEPNQ
ncbi:MAG: pyruvate dehydrogenase (acetyl-transferring) E1 component subunit alpha [Planctomycetota bacterium]